jgi:NAD+ synthase
MKSSTLLSVSSFLDHLAINTRLAHEILTKFIRTEVRRTGLNRVVIGLSGGIDSALVAHLAVDALDANNVLAVRMPYRTSSQDSLDHAQRVIDGLGIQSETFDITPMVNSLISQLGEVNARRAGNIMARQRMVVLYDRSVEFNALVIGTSNKTETLLGYSTQFGDSAAALQPIGDLYKNQVRQLARYAGVPQPVIDKAPSADLWDGQTDEGELGYRYDEVDQLLYLLVDHRYNLDEAIEAGFESAFVDRVWQTVQRTSYKRHMPVVAKLSQRTIGIDFLHMRDWGT